MRTEASKGLHRRIHDLVSRIPRGRVATYGQMARLAGLAGHARLVGYALHALPAGTAVPWHRVVNAQGGISTPPGHDARQRRLLEYEGIHFDSRGRIPLDRYQWRPRGLTATGRPAH
jgi:methylated-DNA-protein-cysteine methyltransferase-like protein